MPILETRELTRCFGSMAAVDHVSLSMEACEVFGLLGPNGAGKTTMIKMLTTLLPPTSGDAWVAGYDIAHHAAGVRHVIGYVPQAISADGQLTGYENLLIFAKLYDIPKAERHQRISDALEFMDLGDAANKLARDYSGGMIRKLEIAQSMLHRPKVLFMDEPTVGLDPGARVTVWERIEQLRAQFGVTIFLTTHLMDEADSLCTRLAIMHLGKVVVTGSPSQLKDSLGREGATLDDVFIHYAGGKIETAAGYNEASRMRRAARRLG